MVILNWQTPAGNLGKYSEQSALNLQFNVEVIDPETLAVIQSPTSIVRYKLLSGSLPAGTIANPVEITSDGNLIGNLQLVKEETTYTFTVRAYDQFGNIRDRTFSITVTLSVRPKISTTSGSILSIYDSKYVSYAIQYVNPVSTNEVNFFVGSGELPPGLVLERTGKITGYPVPPKLSNGSPTVKTYTFSIQLVSALGNDNATFSITITNQEYLIPIANRTPVILNSKPLTTPISNNDPYYAYYVSSNMVIPSIRANEYFTFKIIGHDFDNSEIIYNFNSLPVGLVGDPNTGWISGSPVMAGVGINTYQIKVSVQKKYNPSSISPIETYSIVIKNGLEEDIQWVTPADMGVIYNGTISELKIEATSSKNLVYSLYSGSLPPNLELLESGDIAGKVSFQPTSSLLSDGDNTAFTFSVLVYSDEFPVLKQIKEFTITVLQYFTQPVENIYFKATPNIAGRRIIQSLLTDTSLIPSADLYRGADSNFGKADAVKVLHAYGMTVATMAEYINAINTNHYDRKVILGELKTAVARNENNEIVYEVVYCDVLDGLVNNQGQSIPASIRWPTFINLNLGPLTINQTSIFSSSTDYLSNESPGNVKTLYPASLPNMRTTIAGAIGQTTDEVLLPKWMTSQQENGNTLGFVQSWVICYTLPGKSAPIKQNINDNWAHTLNEIDFVIDRYLIDKSSTYNWNTQLQIPGWSELPSASPKPSPQDANDLVVLFPRRTILPKDIDY